MSRQRTELRLQHISNLHGHRLGGPVNEDPTGNPANLGGAGVWSMNVADWYDQATGMLVSWNDNYAAVFTGTGDIATISGTVGAILDRNRHQRLHDRQFPVGRKTDIFPGGTSIMVANGVVATIHADHRQRRVDCLRSGRERIEYVRRYARPRRAKHVHRHDRHNGATVQLGVDDALPATTIIQVGDRI